MGEIVDYPGSVIECDECGGDAQKFVEKFDNQFGEYEQQGWECKDCGALLAP